MFVSPQGGAGVPGGGRFPERSDVLLHSSIPRTPSLDSNLVADLALVPTRWTPSPWCFAYPVASEAYTPDDPTVQGMIQSGIKFLEANKNAKTLRDQAAQRGRLWRALP